MCDSDYDEIDTDYVAEGPGCADHMEFFGAPPPGFKRRTKRPEAPPKQTERGLNITPQQYKDRNKRTDLYRDSYHHLYSLTRKVATLKISIHATPAQYEILRYKYNKINQVVPDFPSTQIPNINNVCILDQMVWIAHLFLLKGFDWGDIIIALDLSNPQQFILGTSLTFLMNTFEGSSRIKLNAKFSKEEIFAMELGFHQKFKTNGLFFVYDLTRLVGKKGGKSQRALVVCDSDYNIRWSEVVDAEESEEDYKVFQKTDFFQHLLEVILPMKLKLQCRNCSRKHLIDLFGFGDTKSDPKSELYNLTNGLLYKPFFGKGVNMEHRVINDEFVFNTFFEAIRWPIECVIGALKSCKYTEAQFSKNQFSDTLHAMAWKIICIRYNAIKSGFFKSPEIPPKDTTPWPNNSQGQLAMGLHVSGLPHYRCTFDFKRIRRLVHIRYAPGNTDRIETHVTTPTATCSKRPVSPPPYYATTGVKRATLELMDELGACSEDDDF